jgi:hypothetical protein
MLLITTEALPSSTNDKIVAVGSDDFDKVAVGLGSNFRVDECVGVGVGGGVTVHVRDPERDTSFDAMEVGVGVGGGVIVHVVVVLRLSVGSVDHDPSVCVCEGDEDRVFDTGAESVAVSTWGIVTVVLVSEWDDNVEDIVLVYPR